ncbi:MAG: TonB-dependent receptor plug domain-containing protein [Prolixibacteraceae bacterium]|nr:TonB-dependent receptor plug domain-containing protein [Prolixibacteraceae bacterium]
MNKKFFYPLIFTLVFFLVENLQAQDRIIHGMVTTFDSILVNGASVKVKSSKQVVYSDSLGNFSVGVANEDVLVVSAKGFYNQKVKLNEKTKYAAINLNLKPGPKAKEYAIGYGYVNDAEKLNALSSLDKDDMDFSQYSSIFDIIRGRFTGVQVVNGEIQIRGINSINSSTSALIVLDGVTVDASALNSIPTTQVKSINVIKDGSAAIYGARGANGVVLIETRKGND